MSRQSESITRIRAGRRSKGKCAECAQPSRSYRCLACTAARREGMAALMRRKRRGEK